MIRKSVLPCALAMSFIGIQVVSACDVCYGTGVADSQTTRGIGLMVSAMLGTTALVLGGIVAFFFHLQKMAKLAAQNTTSVQHTPLWHFQHAHASGSPDHQHGRNRSFFPGNRGTRT